MNKSWIDTEPEVEFSINLDKIKYLVQNPLVMKSKYNEFKKQYESQTRTFSKFLNELTLIYAPAHNDLAISKQTYHKVRSTKPKHLNKFYHHPKQNPQNDKLQLQDIEFIDLIEDKRKKSPESFKRPDKYQKDENANNLSKKRRMRRHFVNDKVRKQPLRLTTLEPRIYKEEKYIAFMNEAMGNKETSNALTAGKFEKILGDSNILNDNLATSKYGYFLNRTHEKSRGERLRAREERYKERNVNKRDKGDKGNSQENVDLNSLLDDSNDILSSIQILEPAGVCNKCGTIIKDPLYLKNEMCKNCSLLTSAAKSEKSHKIRLEGEEAPSEDDNEPYPDILTVPKDEESRVGGAYQARLPLFNSDFTRDANSKRLKRLRWKTSRLSEEAIEKFRDEIQKKFPKYGLLDEEYCEILVRNKYNIAKAIEWCSEDNRDFEFYLRSTQ